MNYDFSNVAKLQNYIFDNFEISREARYLILNILNYVYRQPEDKQCEISCCLLGGTIGIENEEIKGIYEGE